MRLQPSTLSRGQALRLACISFASVGTLLPHAAIAQPGVPEGMKTSESYSTLQQIAPGTQGTLGAGTISSRSRPETGVILVEEVIETEKTISAELVLDGGVAATATFQSEKGYPLVRGSERSGSSEHMPRACDATLGCCAQVPPGALWSCTLRSGPPRGPSSGLGLGLVLGSGLGLG